MDNSQAFQMSVNGELLTEEPVLCARLRLDQGKTYSVSMKGDGINFSDEVKIPNKMLSSQMVLKQTKKGTMVLRSKSVVMEKPEAQTSSKKFEMEYEYTETSAGPDGVSHRSEKGTASMGDGGLKTKSQSTQMSAGMNESPMGGNMEMVSKTKDRTADVGKAVEGISMLNKARKKAKKNKLEKSGMDGEDVVVLKVCPMKGGEVEVSKETTEKTTNPKASEAVFAPASKATTTNAANTTNTTNAAKPPKALPAASPVKDFKGIGELEPYKGYGFYFLAEPAKRYDEVFKVKAGNFEDLMKHNPTAGFENIQEAFYLDAQKKLGKKKYKGMQIDAFVTQDGEEAMAVVFTESGNEGLSRIGHTKDVDWFIGSNPKQDYEVVVTFEDEKSMSSKPEVIKRMKKSIKRAQKAHPEVEFDAVITLDGIRFDLVSYK